MDDIHIAHLAGVFDAVGTITAHVTRRQKSHLGYRFDPLVMMYRPVSEEALLGKLDAYCEDNIVKHSVSTGERSGTETYIMEIKNAVSIERFLMPMMPYLTTKREYAEIMLKQVLPLVRTDKHLTKEGFYELIGYTEILRETSRTGPEAKYTQEFFEEEWDDLPQTA